MSAAENTPAPQVLSIVGEMTIYRAIELKQTLLAPLAQAGSIYVDLSGVTEIDAAGVQLLMLVRQLADTRQKELRLVACSPAVLDVLELLNLKTYLDPPRESP
ncbi:MAG TPA: STAS domain-containing protein [Polyangia bacterium]|nr:STAS domain-containing protein [Polyangia bacterium]